MTAAELQGLITKNGLHSISIQFPRDETPTTPRFDGTLEEFWVAAKAIEAKVVFLFVEHMDEGDFERPVPSGGPGRDFEEGEEDFDEEIVNLEEVRPGISKYRKYVGKECAFVLQAKGGFAELEFLITESWWDEFLDEAAKAFDAWTETRSAEDEKEEASAAKRKDELIAQLKSLITDREFCLLKTQRAMLAYALEKIPELEELDEYTIKPEIQTLHARIEAKGLNRKAGG